MAARYLKNPFSEELRPPISADELWERVKPLLVELDECELRGAVPRSDLLPGRHRAAASRIGWVRRAILQRGLLLQRRLPQQVWLQGLLSVPYSRQLGRTAAAV